jgi:hypothetical protein
MKKVKENLKQSSIALLKGKKKKHQSQKIKYSPNIKHQIINFIQDNQIVSSQMQLISDKRYMVANNKQTKIL